MIPTILIAALCWLVIPALPFVLLGLLAHRREPSSHDLTDRDAAQGAGDGVRFNHFGASE